jgi:hypothetical protein
MKAKRNEEKKDFTPNLLPHTRWGLFRDILSLQWRTLIEVSLLEVLFALPLFCVYLVFSFFARDYFTSTNDLTGTFAILFYGGVASVIGILFLTIGMAGVFYVSKKLTFLEGTFSASDFFVGLKKEWKRAVGLGLINGLSFGFAFVGTLFLLLNYPSMPVLTGIGIGVLLFQFLIIVTASRYFLSQDFLYANSFMSTYRNSLIFAVIKLPINVAFFLWSPALFLTLLLVNETSGIIGFVLAVPFFSLVPVAFSLYSHKVFDRYINQSHYPDLVGKGLYQEKEDEVCPK